MPFSSTSFIFYFLPLVLLSSGALYLCLFKLVSRSVLTRVINAHLFLSSLVFYYWGENNKIWILLTSITATYLCALLLEQRRLILGFSARKVGIAAGIACNLGFLLWFKYADFGVSTLQSMADALSIEIGFNTLGIALPLGISFFTFQSISYLLDVYWGKIKPTRDPIAFFCYITFFPQLVAGPIVRYYDINTEIKRRDFSLLNLSDGIDRFIIGLSKKVLIANPCGKLADELFAMPAEQLGTFGCWLAAASYGTQILFDFSGYSDMAIGLAKMFGINIPENFNRPYTSKSIREFWRRWHISLSTWFRDYLYIPLGGSQKGTWRTLLNLNIVFITCGLWHGADVTFLLWGLLHGLFITVEHLATKLKQFKAPRALQYLSRPYTLIVVFCAWILFRSETPAQAFGFLNQMLFSFDGISQAALPLTFYSIESQLALVVGLALSLISLPPKVVSIFSSHSKALTYIRKLPLLILLFASIVYIAISTHNPFIYFRF